jgi:hypothetical protein
MQMQVGHRLPPRPVAVDDHAIAFVQPQSPCQVNRGQLESAQKFAVRRRRVRERSDRPFGNDQNMNRRLRVDIPKGEARIVLVHDIRLNFAVDDLLKDVHVEHGLSFSG